MARRLRRLLVSKVQDIVGAALKDWLKKRDYLKQRKSKYFQIGRGS